jgi:hypothetical protein
MPSISIGIKLVNVFYDLFAFMGYVLRATDPSVATTSYSTYAALIRSQCVCGIQQAHERSAAIVNGVRPLQDSGVISSPHQPAP